MLYNDRLDNKISGEFWEKKQKEINDSQEVIREQLVRLKNEETKYFEIGLNILDLARRAREIYKNRSPEDRRTLLKYIFSNLILNDGEMAHTLNKSVSIIAKRVQQNIDAENNLEPNKTLTKQRQKDSFDYVTNTLLRRQGSNL
jgi:hypothetical protein